MTFNKQQLKDSNPIKHRGKLVREKNRQCAESKLMTHTQTNNFKFKYKTLLLSAIFSFLFLFQYKTLLAKIDLIIATMATQTTVIDQPSADEKEKRTKNINKVNENLNKVRMSLNHLMDNPEQDEDVPATEQAVIKPVTSSPAPIVNEVTKIQKVVEDMKSDSMKLPLAKNKEERTKNINQVNENLNKVRMNLDHLMARPEPDEDVPAIEQAVVEPIINSPAPIVKEVAKIQKLVEDRKPGSMKLTTKNPDVLLQPIDKPVSIVNSIEDIKAAYNKHDIDGNLLEDNTEQWACVHDANSGLTWEVKSKDDTMRNPNNLYSWFKIENQISDGIQDGGRCKGDTACDTNAYVQAMNAQNYCGHNDWHLPTREEMQTLVELKNNKDRVKINKQYFPETKASWYWTSSENQDNNNFAWYVLFNNGAALNDLKERSKHIRLVRNNS